MQRLAIILAVLAAAILAGAVGLGMPPLAILQGWLFAAHFWMGVSLGAAVLLLIHAITGGRWGEALRPALLRLAAAMPVAVLAWIPLILAAKELFPWAGQPIEDLPQTVVRKLDYLNVGFLQIRTALVLVLFLGVAWVAGAWSRRVPGTGASAAALAVFGIAVSVFAVDWLLAFEPEFYSTAYPVLHAVGGVVAALALATFALGLAGGDADRLRDCGMLMLGWAMVWLYLAFMSYLIIWSGDLPNEIHWYLGRLQGGWQAPLAVAVFCHVGVVAAMSSPRLQARPEAVMGAAAALVLGQAADIWWRSAPAFAGAIGLHHLIDIAALAVLGWFWIAAVLGQWRREVAHG